MPNQTSKLKLNTWLENEPVNFEEVNANFEKIDSLPICIESGTTTASYTNGSASSATWRYKKYSDGTVEMYTRLGYDNLKCTTSAGSSNLCYSDASTVNFPFTMSEVCDVQMHLQSNSFAYVVGTTNNTITNHVSFRLFNPTYESSGLYRQVFINVKGVLA